MGAKPEIIVVGDPTSASVKTELGRALVYWRGFFAKKRPRKLLLRSKDSLLLTYIESGTGKERILLKQTGGFGYATVAPPCATYQVDIFQAKIPTNYPGLTSPVQFYTLVRSRYPTSYVFDPPGFGEPGWQPYPGDPYAYYYVQVTNGSPPTAWAEANPPPSNYVVWSGSYRVQLIPPGGTSTDQVSGSYTDLWPEMVAESEAANSVLIAGWQTANQGLSYLVGFGDGTLLKTMPYTVDENNSQFGIPRTTTWSGDGWVDLYSLVSGTFTRTGRATFTVPSNAARPAKPDFPPFGSASTVTVTVDDITQVEESFAGSDPVTYRQLNFTSTVRCQGSAYAKLVLGSMDSVATYDSRVSNAQSVFVRRVFYRWPATSGTAEADGTFPLTGAPTFLITGITESTATPDGGGYTFTVVQRTTSETITATTAYDYAKCLTSEQADWVNARETADENESVRLKACGTQFLADMTGAIPVPLVEAIRTGHPMSSKTGYPPDKKMVVEFEEQTIGSGNDVKLVRTTQISFSVPVPGGEPTVYGETIVGSKHTVVTPASGGRPAVTVVTYLNWLQAAVSGSTGATKRREFFRDRLDGLLVVVDGVQTTGATRLGQTWDLYAGAAFSNPTVPMSSDTRVYSYASILGTFRALVGPPIEYSDAIPVVDTVGLDSVLTEGEEILVYPVEVLAKNAVSMGVFPYATPTKRPLQVMVKEAYRYRYAYQTGLAFVSKTTLAAPIYADYDATLPTFLFQYLPKTYWSDVVFTQGTATIPVDQMTPLQYLLYSISRL